MFTTICAIGVAMHYTMKIKRAIDAKKEGENNG